MGMIYVVSMSLRQLPAAKGMAFFARGEGGAARMTLLNRSGP